MASAFPLDEPDSSQQAGNSKTPGMIIDDLSEACQVSEDLMDSFEYSLDNEIKGQALIVDCISFGNTSFKWRSENDCDNMYDLLKTMGFDNIEVLKNPTKYDVINKFKEVSKRDHSTNDCFVCVLLSHGSEGFIHVHDDGTSPKPEDQLQQIEIEKLARYIKAGNCPGLAAKPKLFIIQSSDDSVLDPRKTEQGYGAEVVTRQRRIPVEADFLTIQSVLPHFPDIDGSLFINSLCEVFLSTCQNSLENDRQPAWKSLDICTLLTRVNRRISNTLAQNYSTFFQQELNSKLPVITSMLTKEICFR